MNIVYVGRYNPGEILNGPEKVAKRVFDTISENEQSVFMEYFFDGKKHGVLKKIFGKEIISTKHGNKVIRAGIFTLLIQLIKIKPDIIHIITFERFAFMCFVFKLFFKTKILYNLHGIIIHENKYFRKQNGFRDFKDKFVEKIIIKNSDILFVLSENIKRLLEKYFREIKDIRFIKNGVDLEFGKVNRRQDPENATPLKIVFISDIKRKEKGFDFLKSTLEKTGFDIELYIIGEKENNITLNNSAVKVFYTDKMTPVDLANFLSDKDVFISASSYEPFSISAVEAMASGVIPVLTLETGASELIKEGVNGFTFNYGDENKLNQILKELNGDYSLRKNISKESMSIFNELNWKIITNEYINIYRSLKK